MIQRELTGGNLTAMMIHDDFAAALQMDIGNFMAVTMDEKFTESVGGKPPLKSKSVRAIINAPVLLSGVNRWLPALFIQLESSVLFELTGTITDRHLVAGTRDCLQLFTDDRRGNDPLL